MCHLYHTNIITSSFLTSILSKEKNKSMIQKQEFIYIYVDLPYASLHFSILISIQKFSDVILFKRKDYQPVIVFTATVIINAGQLVLCEKGENLGNTSYISVSSEL